MTETSEIPLFPLNTVLFPGGPLPLRIFEPRYVDMVRRCMRDGTGFGVVMLQRPTVETDADAAIATIGTLARIVDFSQLPEGLLGLSCVGDRKFEVVAHRRQADGLNVADVRWLEPEPQLGVPDEHRALLELLQQLIEQIAEHHPVGTPRYEDASWVGARLAEILPFPNTVKQLMLELSDPIERFEHVGAMIRELVKQRTGEEAGEGSGVRLAFVRNKSASSDQDDDEDDSSDFSGDGGNSRRRPS